MTKYDWNDENEFHLWFYIYWRVRMFEDEMHWSRCFTFDRTFVRRRRKQETWKRRWFIFIIINYQLNSKTRAQVNCFLVLSFTSRTLILLYVQQQQQQQQ